MAKFKQGEEIGSGGFGAVFRGERIDDGWPCALKCLKPGVSPADRQRFNREVRMQVPLKHPNIVRIVAQNLTDDPPWFVMPLAAYSLREYFVRTKPGPKRLWAIRQIAAGLGHAHQNEVLHRDLKPDNVLVFFDEKQKPSVAISDFGLGRLITRDSPSITQTGMRMGTVEYMAPEQYADSKSADGRADIYALGKILFEALTGLTPYPALDLAKVPSDFRYIVQKACEHEAARRYQSVSDFLQDLDQVTAGSESLERPLARVQALIQAVGLRKEEPEELAKVLVNNLDDTSVLMKALPETPVQVLERLFDRSPAMMLDVMRRYDEAVSVKVPFEYCDVVANFYEKVLALASTPHEIRVLMLRRLPVLGRMHNRFFVGDVFARIVANLSDKSDVLAVRDILTEQPDVARWCHDYLERLSLPGALRQVLVRASDTGKVVP
ncbi:MAG: serine/threonine protein kinase [Myxococcaceae bacterium]